MGVSSGTRNHYFFDISINIVPSNFIKMEQILFSGITLDEFIEKVVFESTRKIIKEIKPLISKELEKKEEQKTTTLTRKQTAEYLSVTPPTVDRYTDEGLLKKYGSGKRGKYYLNEVEAAKPAIMASLHKWCSPARKIKSK